MERTRLVVLFGGRSAEHEVSCSSAFHVVTGADPERYEVVPVGVSREGRWIDAADALAALPAGAKSLPTPDGLAGAALEPFSAVASAGNQAVVVFPVFHGPMGEDGSIQGMLEVAGVPYVGAGVLSSALCMDKGAAKDVLAAAGIPQARWRCMRQDELTEEAVAGLVTELGLPLFVKPANMGSSVGISKASTMDELATAIATASSFDDFVIIEEGLDHPREIEIAVLGNANPRASMPGEVVPTHTFYDFEDKYVNGTVGFNIPADLDLDEVERVKSLALDTYRALRVEGMARVDLFYGIGDRGFLVNEVNTIPGFTPFSVFPRLWEAAGLGCASLIDELVGLAMERHERHSRLSTKR